MEERLAENADTLGRLFRTQLQAIPSHRIKQVGLASLSYAHLPVRQKAGMRVVLLRCAARGCSMPSSSSRKVA